MKKMVAVTFRLVCVTAPLLTTLLFIAKTDAQELRIEAALSGEEIDLRFPTRETYYYQVHHLSSNLSAQSSWPVRAMMLATNGTQTWLVPESVATNTYGFFRILEIPLVAPLDEDADGIEDTYELAFPAVLNPFDPVDAQADPDGDNISNIDEANRRSNPTAQDPPVWTLHVPANGTIIGGF